MGSKERMDLADIENYLETEEIPSDTESVDGLVNEDTDEVVDQPDLNSNVNTILAEFTDHDYELFRDLEEVGSLDEGENFNNISLSPTTTTTSPIVFEVPGSSATPNTTPTRPILINIPCFSKTLLPPPTLVSDGCSISHLSFTMTSPPQEPQRKEPINLTTQRRKRQRVTGKPNNITRTTGKLPTLGPKNRPPPTWGCLEENIPSMSGIVKDYIGPAGHILSMENQTPPTLFKCMITDNIIDNMVFQTNLYAEQSGKRYTPTNKTEMEVFLGINILMGIKRLPSYRDYWSSDPDLNDPFISKLMPVNRFSWLLGNLHLNDNEFMPQKGSPEYDKLYKLRPFLDAIAVNFKNNFSPGQVLAVDESMIKFKGRSSLKQYLPKKPIKRGYKLWMLADKSGYVVQFEVYTGKVGEMRQYDLGPNVVKNLTVNLQNKHHTIYIDNYFVSYFLMEDLKSMDINACGTVQSDRKHLPTFKETKYMTRGDSDWRVSEEGVTAMKWIDNKPVLILSNFHDPREMVSVRRKAKDGTRLEVPCPSAVLDYNIHMNCVDRFDQLKSVYEISRKSHKWWHRIFFYFIDAAVVNAFVIHNCLPTSRLDMKTFRRQVVFGLVGQRYVEATSIPGVSPRLAHWAPRVPDEVRKSSSSHQPIRTTRRRCNMCSTKKKQVLTSWLCRVCSVPLCIKPNKTVLGYSTKRNSL